MNFFKNLFKRNKKPVRKTMPDADRINRNQEAVYRAVVALNRPCSGRMVSTYLKWDSASVTNRLCELKKKGRIKVAYMKVGLDKQRRQYYIAVQPKVNEHPGEL